MLMTSKQKSRKIGFYADQTNLEYLELIVKMDPVFRSRSRSQAVNLIIEDYRKRNPLATTTELFGSGQEA